MKGFWGMLGDDNDERENTEEGKLRLRKEELDISKDRVKTGDVELSKDIIEEKKAVDVPVTHEEVVIERRSLDNEASDSPISDEGTIRIPVTEEKVDVDKHTVVTGEVSAYKREVEDTRHIEENLKREEARVRKTGDADVTGDDSIQSFK